MCVNKRVNGQKLCVALYIGALYKQGPFTHSIFVFCAIVGMEVTVTALLVKYHWLTADEDHVRGLRVSGRRLQNSLQLLRLLKLTLLLAEQHVNSFRLVIVIGKI